jgi:hypothetical protein
MRAAIPRPTICRDVIVTRKDGQPFMLPATNETIVMVSAMPVKVVGVEREEDLTILALVCDQWGRYPHKDLCDEGRPEPLPGDTMVWHWPVRT